MFEKRFKKLMPRVSSGFPNTRKLLISFRGVGNPDETLALVFEILRNKLCIIHIPNRTFLVRFGGISGEFGRAMVRILARRRRAKIPMARPNEPDMPPKRTKKIRLGIYRTQI